ncbi:bifunctional 4-hydroxy-2-oxoglutarate aldolase/2-dehydro-3-deoxy-phosphogluconate aldolase [Yinghuangia sp. YIM S09857]|uniref:bifunctional 4-hydroxy-2-oxoglutarate aldolase/2-dehydro-3-deoxy-phosphogluconate aldolase n=1 Tax=Yinghuangia sp. YIM S09857 TaxID=3436929 RepID=UPI003F53336C
MTTVYRWQHLELIARQKVVGIIRAADGEEAARLAGACVAGGLEVVEISLTTPDALDAIRATIRAHPSALVGAGTVLDAASARAAILAGARFLVSPSLHPEVIECAHRHGASAIPGACTPSEALAALSAGADAVKLFPASQWTPSTFRDMRAALPQIPFIPTGSIRAAEAPHWMAAGAVAIGMGASLAAGTPDQSATRIRNLLKSLS